GSSVTHQAIVQNTLKRLLLMRKPHPTPYRGLASSALGLAGLAFLITSAQAELGFLGVAAGDATSTEAVLWTRALDPLVPANAALTLEITADPTFTSGITALNAATDATKDYTCKVEVAGLQPNTVYYYRFVGPASAG